MRHDVQWWRLAVTLGLATCVFGLSACSKFERLSIVRPTAQRGDFEQVAPTYDVSGKGGRKAGANAAQLVAAASASYQAGRFDESRKQAQQAIKADPHSGDAHTIMAAIATRAGNRALAGDHYLKALQSAPDNGAYANNYGIWLCGDGHAQESLPWFDKALADPAYPTPVTALANGATCAQQAGQPVRAEANWRQALSLEPGLMSALAGMTELEFARGKFLDARAFAERWLAISPQDASALQLAVRIEQKNGDNAAAQRYLLRLQALSPGVSRVTPNQ